MSVSYRTHSVNQPSQHNTTTYHPHSACQIKLFATRRRHVIIGTCVRIPASRSLLPAPNLRDGGNLWNIRTTTCMVFTVNRRGVGEDCKREKSRKVSLTENHSGEGEKVHACLPACLSPTGCVCSINPLRKSVRIYYGMHDSHTSLNKSGNFRLFKLGPPGSRIGILQVQEQLPIPASASSSPSAPVLCAPLNFRRLEINQRFNFPNFHALNLI